MGVDVQACSIESTIDGFLIPCKIWRNKNDELPNIKHRASITAAVLFIHGGMFSKGDCDSHPKLLQALSEDVNMIIITSSFRNGAVEPEKTGKTMQDLVDVSDYFQSNFMPEQRLPYGVIGSSSGGYFALALAAQKILRFDFCIPICPVAHPNRRATYLKNCISQNAKPTAGCGVHTAEAATRILNSQLSFWETEEAMEAAGECLRENNNAVPTLLIMGAADTNVPMHVCELVQAWATRTIVLGGAGHEIQNSPPVAKEGMEDGFQLYLPDIERFVKTVRMELGMGDVNMSTLSDENDS